MVMHENIKPNYHSTARPFILERMCDLFVRRTRGESHKCNFSHEVGQNKISSSISSKLSRLSGSSPMTADSTRKYLPSLLTVISIGCATSPSRAICTHSAALLGHGSLLRCFHQRSALPRA